MKIFSAVSVVCCSVVKSWFTLTPYVQHIHIRNFVVKKDATYKEIYLQILELCGKELKITKYNIYTEKEFIEKIKEALRVQEKLMPDMIIQLKDTIEKIID